MIKEIVIKYKQVAFDCHTNKQLKKFIDIATSEIKFSKSYMSVELFEEDKEFILDFYTSENETIALIIYEEYDNGRNEFQFYSRCDSDSRIHKVIDFNQLLRKNKIKNIYEIKD